jgi:F0F1-type ATP synthase assembly protein I
VNKITSEITKMGESKEARPSEGESPTSAQAMGDWSQAGGFFSSILSGLVIGLAADYFLNTEPWLVVGGIIAGFVVGFWRMIVFSNRIMEQASNPRLLRIARMRRAAELEDEEDEL